MKTILTYTTPLAYTKPFKEFYSEINIKQIKFLSLIIFVVTALTQIISFTYQDKIYSIKIYNELYLLNYIKLIGSIIFFLLSSIVLKKTNFSEKYKKNLTLSFILFAMLISLFTSYIVSSYNPKNTLTIYLIGVVMVGLFFVIEYKHIIATAIFISSVFILCITLPQIDFEDKLLNGVIGLVISVFLISLSRFNYFYKSQNFIKIKELEEKNAEIEKLNKEKNDILNFVAHDLRNPLNNIEALSNLMLLSGKNNDEAEMISSSTKHAKEIINDLLDGVNSNYEHTNLSEKLTTINQKWFTNTQRTINFDDQSEKNIVNINPSKLERVIDNLISNGIKFSEDHHPINISLTNTDSEIFIKIEDFGIGIPKHLQQNVFDQFSKSGRTGLNGEKSTGLGLHISKKIIQENKGRLLMNSEENKGTIFTIILPLV